MNDYDIQEALKRIEDELIASMMRNMQRHRAEETKEGIEWGMWQAEQLRALEEYRKRNAKKYNGQFEEINSSIPAIISESRKRGYLDQEAHILETIGQASGGSGDIDGAFFKINDRKMNALIDATVSDMGNAETAMLRRANDQYRKTIFNAQVYANSGVGTYEKAVDMATKDFLAAGIQCIQYKNGSMHRIEEYAGMAIRTASKRAYLTGEGEKRKEWGCHLVIMNKRGNPCPKCLPFVGKILIDDVWSGGSSEDGSYPLMSSAMAAGLYHPNCKDSHTTYFPGISTPPDDKFSREEIKQVEEDYKDDQKQQYAQRQEEKFGRLANYSLDSENKRKYAIKKAEWEKVIPDKPTTKPLLERGTAAIDYRAKKVTFKDLREWRKTIGNVTDEEYAIIDGMNDAGYIRNSNAYKINKALRDGTVDQLSDASRQTLETLRDVIDKNVSDTDAVLLRRVDNQYIEDVFGISAKDPEDIIKELNSKKLGDVYTEKGFVSTSYKANKNLNNADDILLDIYAPEGTNMFLTHNREESEIILQAGTKFEVKGATLTDDGKVKVLVDVKKDVGIDNKVLDIKDKALKEGKENAKIKLKDKITETDIQITDLKKQFSNITDGYSYDEWFNEFDSIEDGFGGADDNDESFNKLKELDSKIKEQSQKKNELLHQKEKRKQLDNGYSDRVPDDELDDFNKKALEQIKSDTGYSDDKALEFQDTLKEYFGGNYEAILAGQTQEAKIIRDGIDRMPVYEGSINRGLMLDSSNINAFSGLKPGDELPQKGMIESWSSEKGTATAFSGISDYERNSVLLECEHNETAVGVQHLSSFGKVESEVLSSSKYEVVEMVTENKYDYLSKHKEYLYFPEDLENEKEVLKENVVCIIKVKEKN